MLFRFGEFELDSDLRELRFQGRPRGIQPKAFAVLEYLLRHRARVVSKEELLETLWPDTYVTDGSLQRAVSLVRAALETDSSRIRTVPRHGYRFVGPVECEGEEGSPSATFHPRFALSGNIHIAYETIGEGETDLVLVPGWVFPMHAFFDHPDVEAWLQGLQAFGRVVVFDKRGTGLSDRVKSLPTLEERADDLRVVLDALGSKSAVLLGLSEGGPLSILFAASFPHRVRGLLVAGSFARWSVDPGYPFGWTPEAFEELRRYITTAWGSGRTITSIVESRAGDPRIAQWAARAEQEGASPGAALDLLEMNLQVDVRAILPTVSVPTVVLHGRRDGLFPVENARYLAGHIPGARLVEVDTADHAFVFEGTEALHEALEWLLGQSPPDPVGFLATTLALEAVHRPGPAVEDSTVVTAGGVSTGVNRVWRFDGPQRAMRCARDLLALPAMRERGARAGVHVGEVSRTHEGLAGDGVDTAVALARSAPAGEVWISRVVQDLIPGSAYSLEERGRIQLPDGRRVRALACLPQQKISER